MKNLLLIKNLLQVTMLLILVMCGTLSFGQDRTINGKVTANEDGNALPGVTVLVKGSTISSQTNASGNFSIRFPSASTELEFSYLGYVTQTVQVGPSNTLNVSMTADTRLLGEVVVTALGITRETKSLTYSTQSLKSDELNKTTGVNMNNALQGKVAGLTLTRGTGGITSGSSIILRGNRSITGSNAPLYITDGVPGSSGMDNGDNIESISVLKGAAAAALYGSAGQNGVIIITTKKGVAGKTFVEFNGGLVFDQPDILIDYQTAYGQGDAGLYVASSEHSYGPKMTGQTVTLWNGTSVPLSADPDRLKNFFRTGLTLNNSLSINTGADKIQTYISYSNIRAQGIMETNALTRHNVNIRVANTISPKLSIDSKVTYNYQDGNSLSGNGGSWALRVPVSIPLSEMRKFEYTDSDGNLRQSYWKPGSSIQGNPYWSLYRNTNDSKSHRIVALLSAKYDINNWMSLQLRGNVNQSFSSGWNKTYADSYASQVGSNFSTSNGNSLSSNMDGLLAFKHDLIKDVNLSGHIGGYIAGSHSESSSQSANGLFKRDYFYMTNALAASASNDFSQSPQIQSLYSSLSIAYKDYLYLDVTGRNDWSSALPKGQESIFYPSIGVTAIVSDMVKLPSWVSFGKARVSSAHSGFGGNAYLSREYYSVSAGGAIISPTVLSPGDYKPELTTSLEVGLDWKFLNNRLGFDVTYYETKTSNQLLLIGAPSATLYAQKYINAGLVENKGIELLMNGTPLKMGKLSWDATFNFSKNNNKVVKLTEVQKVVILRDDASATIKVEEGKPFATMYVKGWQRDAKGNKLVDVQGRPLLTGPKSTYIGLATPNYMASLTNSFNYSNVSLSFQIDKRDGGRIIGFQQGLLDADGHSQRSLEGRETGIIIDGYTAAGVKNDKSITSQAYYGAIGDRYPTGEEYNYSGSNVRLREVSLNYKVPAELFSNSKYIKSVNVAFSGRNLFFFQRTAPFDPDLAQNTSGGGGYNDLPFTRTYALNLKVTF